MIGGIIKIFLISIFVFLIPSYLLTQLSKKKDFEKFFLNLMIVFIFLPLISFYLILITNNFFTLISISIIATILNLALIIFVKYKKCGLNRISIRKRDYVILIILLVVFVFNFLTFSFPEEDRYECQDDWVYANIQSEYRYHPKHTVINNLLPSSFYNYSNTGEGILYYELKHNYKSGPQTNWVERQSVWNDEPFSIGIHQSFFIGLFNFLGIRIMFSLIMACSSILIFFIIRNFEKGLWFLSILAIILLNTSLIAKESHSANINYLGLLLVTIIMYMLTRKNISTKEVILTGALYGFLGSIRPITILFIPGIILYFYHHDLKKIIPFGISSLVLISPVMVINYFLYGNPLQFPGFFYRPLIEHNLFGLTFYVRQLFNFPFYTHIVRSRGYPYPVFFYLPLMMLKNFGLILFSTIFFGLKEIRNKKLRYFFLVTPLLPFILFLVSEDWESQKTTLLLLILPFIIFFSINGLKTIIKNFKDKRKLILFSTLLFLIIICMITIRDLDFPVDKRQGLVMPYLIEENEKDIIYQRKELTNINLFPLLSFNKINIDELTEDMKLKRELPPFLEKFAKCINERDDIIGYNFIKKEEKIYLTIPHIKDKEDVSIDMEEINISKNDIIFRDISSPNHCYTFNLRIIKNDNEIDFFVDNISQRSYNKTIGKEIEIILEDKNIDLKLFENDKLMANLKEGPYMVGEIT